MKKFLIGILTIIITILILLLSLSYSAEDIIVNNVSNVIVKKKITSTVTDTVKKVIPNVNADSLINFENKILNSEQVILITKKYFNNIVESVVNDENVSVPDISKELTSLINENKDILDSYGIVVPSEKLVRELVNSKLFNTVYVNTISEVKKDLTKKQVAIIKVYDGFTDYKTRNIIIVSIIVLTLLISFLKKSIYKSMINIGISSVISGLLMLFIIPLILDNLSKKLISNTYTLNINNFTNLGFVPLVLGFGLIIVYMILKFIDKRIKVMKKENA